MIGAFFGRREVLFKIMSINDKEVDMPLKMRTMSAEWPQNGPSFFPKIDEINFLHMLFSLTGIIVIDYV